MPLWNSAADWDAAQADSGVIHRNYGDYSESQIALGAEPDFAMADWFAGSGTSQTFVENIRRTAVYDATSNKTFVVWQADNMHPFAAHYDHVTGQWSNHVQVGNNPMSTDDHGAPIIEIDGNGYLHAMWGSHNAPQKYAISANPRDITTWTAQTDAGSACTYPALVFHNGALYFFYRQDVGDHKALSYQKATSTASGHGWGSIIQLVNFGSGTWIYPADFRAYADQIHITFFLRDERTTSVFLHAYHAIIDTANADAFTAMDGGTLTTPVNETTANAELRVFDSGTDVANLPVLDFDAGGYPQIAFVHVNSASSDTEIKFCRWDGTAWTAPQVVAGGAVSWKSPEIFWNSATSVTIYGIHANASAAVGGGDLKRYEFDPTTGGATTTNVRLIDTANGSFGFESPHRPVNHHAGLRLLFSENNNEVNNMSYLRLYAVDENDNVVGAPIARSIDAGHFALNETAAPVVSFDSARGKSWIASNTPNVVFAVAGVLGQKSVSLNGTSAFIDLGSYDDFYLFGNLPTTVRVWAKDYDHAILSMGKASSSKLRFYVRLDTANSQMRLLTKTGASFKNAASNVVAGFGGWHLYEWMWNGSNTITFRMDGADVGADSTTFTASDFEVVPDTSCFIGKVFNSQSDANFQSYGSGVLQDLRLLRRHAGTLAEHQAVYEALTSGSFTSSRKVL